MEHILLLKFCLLGTVERKELKLAVLLQEAGCLLAFLFSRPLSLPSNLGRLESPFLRRRKLEFKKEKHLFQAVEPDCSRAGRKLAWSLPCRAVGEKAGPGLEPS